MRSAAVTSPNTPGPSRVSAASRRGQNSKRSVQNDASKSALAAWTGRLVFDRHGLRGQPAEPREADFGLDRKVVGGRTSARQPPVEQRLAVHADRRADLDLDAFDRRVLSAGEDRKSVV